MLYDINYKLKVKIMIDTMSYHNRRLLSAKSEHACSSLIQMQKLGSAQLVCKLHERSSFPSSVSFAPTRLQSVCDRDQRPPAVPANHVFSFDYLDLSRDAL